MVRNNLSPKFDRHYCESGFTVDGEKSYAGHNDVVSYSVESIGLSLDVGRYCGEETVGL
jgi:hypothetical protein